jgi:hypothetical protein
MLDQLMKLVEENAGDAIINNPAIPNQHNSAAIQDVASQIFGGLQSQASGGNIQDIVSMFQNGGSSSIGHNPVVANIISSVAANFASKFGVSLQVAQGIASSLLPTVMNQLISKTNDPNDSSFDLGGILKSTTGNSGLDVGSILGQMTGGGNNNPLGNIGGMLGGLFK